MQKFTVLAEFSAVLAENSTRRAEKRASTRFITTSITVSPALLQTIIKPLSASSQVRRQLGRKS